MWFRSFASADPKTINHLRKPQRGDLTSGSSRGVAVLIVPADVARAKAPEQPRFAAHSAHSETRPTPVELGRLADLLNKPGNLAIYGGA